MPSSTQRTLYVSTGQLLHMTEGLLLGVADQSTPLSLCGNSIQMKRRPLSEKKQNIIVNERSSHQKTDIKSTLVPTGAENIEIDDGEVCIRKGNPKKRTIVKPKQFALNDHDSQLQKSKPQKKKTVVIICEDEGHDEVIVGSRDEDKYTTCRKDQRKRRNTLVTAGTAAPHVEHATACIQRVYRGSRERKQYLKKKRATLNLQTWYRSRSSRRRFLMKRSRATTIQKIYRGYSARKICSNMNKAALLIQRSFRNHKLAKMVCTIQAIVRGFLQRRCLSTMKHASTQVQGCWRRASLRMKYLKLKKATIYLQSVYRQRVACRKVRCVRQTYAATTMQKYIRRRIARKSVEEMRLKHSKKQATAALLRSLVSPTEEKSIAKCWDSVPCSPSSGNNDMEQMTKKWAAKVASLVEGSDLMEISKQVAPYSRGGSCSPVVGPMDNSDNLPVRQEEKPSKKTSAQDTRPPGVIAFFEKTRSAESELVRSQLEEKRKRLAKIREERMQLEMKALSHSSSAEKPCSADLVATGTGRTEIQSLSAVPQRLRPQSAPCPTDSPRAQVEPPRAAECEDAFRTPPRCTSTNDLKLRKKRLKVLPMTNLDDEVLAVSIPSPERKIAEPLPATTIAEQVKRKRNPASSVSAAPAEKGRLIWADLSGKDLCHYKTAEMPPNSPHHRKDIAVKSRLKKREPGFKFPFADEVPQSFVQKKKKTRARFA